MKRQTVKEINKRLEKYFGCLVKIVWGDAQGNHFIEDIEHMTELADIESAGWIVFTNKEVVTICSFKTVEYCIEIFDDVRQKFRYYIAIPRKTIRRVIPL